MSIIPIKGMDCDAAPQSAEKSMSIGGDPRSSHSPTPMCILPDEIFIKIIRLSINAETPVQDLATLIAVCRPWKRILEATPALWSEINASEGLGCIRKALRMAQGALLNIQVTRASSAVDLEAFSREIRGRILQWKTLLVEHDDWPQFVSLAGLESTAPPQLERLHLIHSQPSGPHENAISLFGGEPAPPSLKDVRLEWVPVAVAPLRLSGLTSLVLSNPIHVPLGEIVRVLEESPALRNLELSWWGPSASEDEELAHPSISSRGQTIHLTSLHSLILLDIPPSIIRILLSVLRIPNVERIHINNMSQASPISTLVTADLDHLIPILLRITSAADRIRMTFFKNSYFSIVIGDFEFHWSTQLEHVPVFFDWLFIHVGVQPKEIPTAIALLKCAHNLPQMEWLNSNFKVTRLALCSDRFSPQDPNELLSFLSHPITVGSSGSTPKWLFPNLEVLLSYSDRPQNMAKVASMVQERHSVVKEDSTGVVPKPLREIRLASACPPMFVIDIPADENALRTIQREGRGAEVYWEGQKWTGS